MLCKWCGNNLSEKSFFDSFLKRKNLVCKACYRKRVSERLLVKKVTNPTKALCTSLRRTLRMRGDNYAFVTEQFVIRILDVYKIERLSDVKRIVPPPSSSKINSNIKPSVFSVLLQRCQKNEFQLPDCPSPSTQCNHEPDN